MAKTLADETEFVNALWYGRQGSGKTTNLAHLAKLGKVKYAAIEPGLKAGPLRKLGVPLENIEPYREWMLSALEGLEVDLREQLYDDPAAYVGVVWDSATELVARNMERIVDEQWAETEREAARRQDPELVRPSKRYFVSRDYWGLFTQPARRIVRHYRDLPCHFGIAAQIRRDEDEDSGATYYGPAVNPAFSGDIMGYMDFVIRTEIGVDGETFIGYTRINSQFAAKDRYGVLPRILVSPTFDRVIAYAEGKLNKEDDPLQAAYREVVAERKASRKRRRGEEAT